MCGITAYAGARPARDLLLAGLEHLEYRGYDSAGIALQEPDGSTDTIRSVGPIAELRAAARHAGGGAPCGLGHTRWATHGAVTEANAHPHSDPEERVSLVLNGIIENHEALRDGLGPMRSQTDAEVVAHLLAREEGPLHEAVRSVNRRLEGQFSYVAMRRDEPGVLAGTRQRTPLVAGLGHGEVFLASATPAFLEETDAVLELADGDVAVATAAGVTVFDADGAERDRPVRVADETLEAAERGGFTTFMEKEIHEQPTALEATLAAPVPDLGAPRRVMVVGCGTSLHAGLAGRDAIEAWAGIPCAVEFASEWQARDPLVGPGDLVIGVTQSGETADTLAAMRIARERGAGVLAITNVAGSQATREADAVLATRAGLEIGVAATKTFTAQVAALVRVAQHLAGHVPNVDGELRVLPALVEELIERSAEPIAAAAERWADASYFLFMGRHAGYPVALEGALKLKEVAYVAADAYPAGEMKHGPIALIEDGTPVVAVGTTSPVIGKLASNVAEVRARGADVLAITTAGDDVLESAIAVPRTDALLQPLLATIPLQLLALGIATRRNLDVDRPRNLAKTVTVE